MPSSARCSLALAVRTSLISSTRRLSSESVRAWAPGTLGPYARDAICSKSSIRCAHWSIAGAGSVFAGGRELDGSASGSGGIGILSARVHSAGSCPAAVRVDRTRPGVLLEELQDERVEPLGHPRVEGPRCRRGGLHLTDEKGRGGVGGERKLSGRHLEEDDPERIEG